MGKAERVRARARRRGAGGSLMIGPMAARFLDTWDPDWMRRSG